MQTETYYVPADTDTLADVVAGMQSAWPFNATRCKLGAERLHDGERRFIMQPNDDGVARFEIGFNIGLNWKRHFDVTARTVVQ